MYADTLLKIVITFLMLSFIGIPLTGHAIHIANDCEQFETSEKIKDLCYEKVFYQSLGMHISLITFALVITGILIRIDSATKRGCNG